MLEIYGKQKIKNIGLGERLASFFYRRSDSKFLDFEGHTICHNYSTLLLAGENSHKHYIKELHMAMFQ